MLYYAITINSKLLGLTYENPYGFSIPNTSIHEFDGTIPDLNYNVWDQNSESFIKNSKILTPLEFLNRFSITERVSIRSSTDPIVNDIMNLLDAAEYIDCSNPTTIQGVGYLTQAGLVAPERLTEILK